MTYKQRRYEAAFNARERLNNLAVITNGVATAKVDFEELYCEAADWARADLLKELEPIKEALKHCMAAVTMYFEDTGDYYYENVRAQTKNAIAILERIESEMRE